MRSKEAHVLESIANPAPAHPADCRVPGENHRGRTRRTLRTPDATPCAPFPAQVLSAPPAVGSQRVWIRGKYGWFRSVARPSLQVVAAPCNAPDFALRCWLVRALIVLISCALLVRALMWALIYIQRFRSQQLIISLKINPI